MAMPQELVKAEGSDEWWFKQLFDELHLKERRNDDQEHPRAEWMGLLWDRYTGDSPLPKHAPEAKKKAARQVMRIGRSNLGRLAVLSLMDRIRFKGVDIIAASAGARGADGLADEAITGGAEVEADASIKVTEEAARRIMRDNAAAFQDAFRDSAVMSVGYLWAAEVNGKAIATSESPKQCVTIDDPYEPDKVVAALKVYTNRQKKCVYAHVALPATPDIELEDGTIPGQPARLRVARREGKTAASGATFSASSWTWVDELEAEDPEKYGDEPQGGPFPIQDRGVFVHKLEFTDDMGLFEPHLDLLDRITSMIVDRIWISKIQAFRQRALKDKNTDPDADPLPEKDEKGQTIDYDAMFESDPDALWKLPIGVEIWESTPTDMQGALNAVKDDLKEFFASTRTPAYTFSPDAVGGSAEGAALAREAQVFHAETIIDRWIPVMVRVAGDLLAIDDVDVDEDAELEPVFLPPERYSLQQRTDAAVKAKAVGVPTEAVWTDFLQADPATVARWRRLRNQDLLYAAKVGQQADVLPPGLDPANQPPAPPIPPGRLPDSQDIPPRQPVPPPAPTPPAGR